MFFLGKLEKILEDSLDSIQSPSTSLKIQIIGGKVYLKYRVSHIEMVETKWLWGVVELRILMNYGV